ncbi:MFS transporter [Atlantibacter sp.]|uniref:MFS transporter n=1 Tax=Atlantibacter sp. TaxID=1903473 RepID=UPI0028AC784C|nr:MFS transporter [Atlantibacter sp.]
MFSRLSLVMMTALLMFPQIAETLYSPALTHISDHFLVTADDAAQTLSVYFIGFAFGVLFWGRLCDALGRKPAIIAGLCVYALGTAIALVANDFTLLLTARVISAFGAATGSVVTQTMLRDRFSGHQLASIFSFIGIALAISPAIGVYAGGVLASRWGFYGVFIALASLAVLLLAGCLTLPETRPAQRTHIPIIAVVSCMAGDSKIWLATLLVASFNVSLFSYYSLAPFLFERLHYDAQVFGYSGIALAAGSVIGSSINRGLLKQGKRLEWLLAFACTVNLIGSIGVFWLSHSVMFLIPMTLVTAAFSMAIPVVLGSALSAYGDCRGTAGALFGLCYYLLIGCGLALSGWGQSLGASLVISALFCGIAAWRYLPKLSERQS